MTQDNDAETDDSGRLEGGGSGGGSEPVREYRPEEERGGSRATVYVVIALILILVAFPVLRLFGAVSEAPALTWLYALTLVIALLIVIPFVYGMIRKST